MKIWRATGKKKNQKTFGQIFRYLAWFDPALAWKVSNVVYKATHHAPTFRHVWVVSSPEATVQRMRSLFILTEPLMTLSITRKQAINHTQSSGGWVTTDVRCLQIASADWPYWFWSFAKQWYGWFGARVVSWLRYEVLIVCPNAFENIKQNSYHIVWGLFYALLIGGLQICLI